MTTLDDWSIDYGKDGSASLWCFDCGEIDFDPMGQTLIDIIAAANDHECGDDDE